MVACARFLFEPPACLAEETVIQKFSSIDNMLIEVPVSQILPGDEIFTLNRYNDPIITRVVSNTKTEGVFMFHEFLFNSTGRCRKLRVTPDHGMILAESEQHPVPRMLLSAAADVQKGHHFPTVERPAEITHVRAVLGNNRYTLVTVEGTVLADGALVTVLCENEIKLGEEAHDVLKVWKEKHRY